MLLFAVLASIASARPIQGQDAGPSLPEEVRSHLLAAEYSCAGLRLIRGFWFSPLGRDSAAALLRDLVEGSAEIPDPGRRAILGMARDLASAGPLLDEIEAVLERVPEPEDTTDPALVWMELGSCAFSSAAADAAIFATKTYDLIDDRWRTGTARGTLGLSDFQRLYAPLVELWAEAVRLAPDAVAFREIHASQASTWGDVDDAVAQAREAVRLSNSREETQAVLASVLRQRAVTLQRRGRTADALADLDEAAPLGPRAAPMLIRQRVELMAGVGRAEEARGWIEEIRPAYTQEGWDRFFEQLSQVIDARHRAFLAMDRDPPPELSEVPPSSSPSSGGSGSVTARPSSPAGAGASRTGRSSRARPLSASEAVEEVSGIFRDMASNLRAQNRQSARETQAILDRLISQARQRDHEARRTRTEADRRRREIARQQNTSPPIARAPSLGSTGPGRDGADRQEQGRPQDPARPGRGQERQMRPDRPGGQEGSGPPSWVDPTSPHPPCRGAGLGTIRESDVRAQCQLHRLNHQLVENFRRSAQTITITVHSSCEVEHGSRQEGAVTNERVDLRVEGVISGSRRLTGAWWGTGLPQFQGGNVILPNAPDVQVGNWLSPRWQQYRITYDRRRHPSGPAVTFGWSIGRPFQLSEQGSRTTRVRDGGVYDFQGRSTGGLPGCFR